MAQRRHLPRTAAQRREAGLARAEAELDYWTAAVKTSDELIGRSHVSRHAYWAQVAELNDHWVTGRGAS